MADQPINKPVDRDALRKAARGGSFGMGGFKGGGRTIEGKLVASSENVSAFKEGERVFHDKFGYGTIRAVEGNKLTIEFEKAGEKHVLDSFVERH